MCSQHGRVCTFINAEIGQGLFQAYTHIYFKDDFIAQGPTMEDTEVSRVDICPALTCCFSVSKQLMGYLLPVRQDVLFFSFSQILFFRKKFFHMYWLSFLNAIRFYLVFFLRKLFFAYSGKAVKITFSAIYFLENNKKMF